MHADRPPDGATGGTRRLRVAEGVVCGVLAAAVLLSTVEAFVRPAAPWWPFVWQNAWTLSAITLGCWVVLRTTEKADARAKRRPAAPPGDGSATQDGDEEPSSRGQ
ncbi:hypothetical protein [Streptomyces sp. NPDC058434]|uniref:hypothetical protein n=1 Tax=Streptomyces sp. NPDC058434 TaxID=3346498 RepID=UPI0036575516